MTTSKRAIEPHPLPADALLRRYADGVHFTDCYATTRTNEVTLAEFVTAFYTTPLFRLERFILARVASKPSTDDEVRALANGTGERFAAWEVEARSDDQLLLRDYSGRTRSWLMVGAGADENGRTTHLYFGSAVIAGRDRASALPRRTWLLNALMPFHRLYSRALLAAARRRLESVQR